jgi:hypothetical protein
MKQTRFGVPAALAIAQAVSYASVEWPILYSLRAVGITESVVRECNLSFPIDAESRLAALARWKSRNESIAIATREFNIERVRRESPQLDLGGLDAQLDELEKSAISQVKRSAPDWQRMCADMPRWLESEESDVVHQVADFMRAKK